ncbi:trans-aconitate methyltransferase [Pseudorhizobium tarimense]|uniref:Trans-aconitate methyltransferase n=1 Tax=Pseudorhizobium tarimense TaxID=1079109 RepID=A0ABV2H8U9_9HYPH|nr:class I SAM-dependent methyltransferase [Pseudorhizobium tarimense]MCJ8520083.1 class I SAM-dependent methyltransferase [Pseudorhizobium tarimense]
MSGFGKDWLALREPVDRRSRDAALLDRAVHAVQRQSPASVLDIGCGTGSTFRTLAPKLRGAVSWTLFDYDEDLLAEAERRHASDDITFVNGDLTQISALPLDRVTLVTASALFDLCSHAFMKQFVETLAWQRAAIYAALNYDGEMHWSMEHPADEAVTKAFNAHQLTDKGFGPSAGADAWRVLKETLEMCGFSVSIAESPWLMGRDDADLQRQFLDGVARAVSEEGSVDAAELRDWHQSRLQSISQTASLCRVGHQDVLALI